MSVAQPTEPIAAAAPRRPRALRLVQTDLRRMPPAWEPLLSDGVRPLLVVGDLGASLISLPAGNGYLITELAFAAILILLFHDGGLYRSRLALSVLDDLPCILRRWLMATAMLLGGCLLLGVETTLGHAFAVGVAVVVTRALLYFVVRTLRRVGTVAHPTIVIGAEHAGRDMVSQLRAHPECGLRPLGFIDRTTDDPAGLGAAALRPLRAQHRAGAARTARAAAHPWRDAVRTRRSRWCGPARSTAARSSCCRGCIR